MDRTRILISGGGTAGLTLAIALKQHGFEPVVIERENALRPAGFMMDFFGTGWDVADRLGLIDRLCTITYPIEALAVVDPSGAPYLEVPVDRLRDALARRYLYLRRQDLEHILAERACELGVEVRHRTLLHSLTEQANGVRATFANGKNDDFALVIGADGVHSRVRMLMFGPQRQYERFLGLHVAAFHVERGAHPLGSACKLYEESDRSAFFYPIDDQRLDATYVFRDDERHLGAGHNISVLRSHYRGAGWIAEEVLHAVRPDDPLYFEGATQIIMPHWHRGRVALIGDACGCLTLPARDGSHMAMAGAFVLARELARHSNHEDAFRAYQDFLKPHVDRRQRDAARLSRHFVPSKRSNPWLRRLVMRLLFSNFGLRTLVKQIGAQSVLAGQG